MNVHSTHTDTPSEYDGGVLNRKWRELTSTTIDDREEAMCEIR